MAKFIISVCGGQFELQNEPVHLVDADGDGHSLLDSVFDQTLCVQHHLDTDIKKLQSENVDVYRARYLKVGAKLRHQNRKKIEAEEQQHGSPLLLHL